MENITEIVNDIGIKNKVNDIARRRAEFRKFQDILMENGISFKILNETLQIPVTDEISYDYIKILVSKYINVKVLCIKDIIIIKFT